MSRASRLILPIAFFVLMAAGPVSAMAQTSSPEPCKCRPLQNDDDFFALILSHNLAGGPGPWLLWACYPQVIPPGSLEAPAPTYCSIMAPWSAIDLRRLGDRADTIRRATDQAAAFAASWRRHVVLRADDQSLLEIRAAIRADLRSLTSPQATK